MSNKVEIKKPIPVEEYYEDSPNDRLRNFALRILELRKEIRQRALAGSVKLLVFIPIWAISTYSFIQGLAEGNLAKTIIPGVGVFCSGFLVASGIQNLTAASVARNEFSSLITVLAAEAIAESK